MAQAAAALHPLLPRTNFQPEDREPHGGDAKLRILCLGMLILTVFPESL